VGLPLKSNLSFSLRGLRFRRPGDHGPGELPARRRLPDIYHVREGGGGRPDEADQEGLARAGDNPRGEWRAAVRSERPRPEAPSKQTPPGVRGTVRSPAKITQTDSSTPERVVLDDPVRKTARSHDRSPAPLRCRLPRRHRPPRHQLEHERDRRQDSGGVEGVLVVLVLFEELAGDLGREVARNAPGGE